MSISWKTLLTVACVAALGISAHVSAQEDTKSAADDAAGFGPALDRLVVRLQQYVAEKGNEGTTIQVGEFKSPAGGSGGRLIQTELVERLKVKNIKLVDEVDNPNWVIEGKLSFVGDKQKVAVLKISLTDGAGNELRDFDESFNGDPEIAKAREAASKALASEGTKIEEGAVSRNQDEVAQLFQRTVDFVEKVETSTSLTGTTAPPATAVPVTPDQKKAAQAAKQEAVRVAFDSKTAPHFVPKKNGAIAASEQSLFEVRIRATANNSNPNPGDAAYQPIAVVNRGGEAFAEMKEGQFYCVDIINRAKHAVGVELMIDGINSLELCQIAEWKSAGKFVIEAGKQITIPGWLLNSNQFSLFELTPEPQGKAVELGRVQKIGVVTATFYTAWNENENEPVFEQLLAGSVKSRNIATAQGPTVDLKQEEQVKPAKKFFGEEPMSIVSVRYRNPEPTDLPTDAAP